MRKLDNIPKKMKALVLESVGNLVYKEVDNYDLVKGSVIVKIKYCGICSSDVERVFVTGTYHFPTIPGHEMSGQIVAVNDEDNDLLGKKVSIFPMLPCMKCDACRKEEYAQCANYNYFGSRCDGGYAEYLLVPKWNLVVFDDSIDYKIASLCEPAAVGVHATNILDVKKDQKIAISGTGTIAILIGYFCKFRGAKVSIVGRNDKKLGIIEKMGFSVINVKNVDKYKSQFDSVVEAVGSNDSINQSIDLVNTFGKVLLVGNPKEDVLLDKNIYWKILRKQLWITGSWNSSYNDKINDWKEVIEYMKNGDIPFDKLITKEYTLDKSSEAFSFVRDKSINKFKVVFNIDEKKR